MADGQNDKKDNLKNDYLLIEYKGYSSPTVTKTSSFIHIFNIAAIFINVIVSNSQYDTFYNDFE